MEIKRKHPMKNVERKAMEFCFFNETLCKKSNKKTHIFHIDLINNCLNNAVDSCSFIYKQSSEKKTRR